MRGVIVLALFSLFAFSPVLAGDLCQYCGTWLPWSGPVKDSHDIVTLSASVVSLPGCAPTPAVQLQNRAHPSIFSAASTTKPFLAYLKLLGPLQCRWKGAPRTKQTLLEIEGGSPNELVLNLLERDAIPDRPGSSGSETWWAISEQSHPCDEGSQRGAMICGKRAVLVADTSLNESWTGLITDKDQKAIELLRQRQRQWMRRVRSYCSKNSHVENQFTPYPSIYAEDFCLANHFDHRVDEFREVNACLKGVEPERCSPLSAAPNKSLERTRER
jgi:uncharacterized protein YecT (DUF1311 family)